MWITSIFARIGAAAWGWMAAIGAVLAAVFAVHRSGKAAGQADAKADTARRTDAARKGQLDAALDRSRTPDELSRRLRDPKRRF